MNALRTAAPVPARPGRAGRLLPRLLLAAALLAAVPGPAAAAPPTPAPAPTPAAAPPPPAPLSGPLRVENAYPPMLPFLLLPAEAPAGLPPGGLMLAWAVSYGNVFHYDPEVLFPDLEVLFDGEVYKLALDAGYGMAPGLSVGARFWLAGAYGGIFDPLIQGFHAAFNLPNADRDLYPDNRYGLRLIRGEQVMVDLPEPFAAAGDLEIAAKWTLRQGRGRGPGAALQAAVSLPVGSPRRLTSSGALDLALGALGSWRWSHLAVYGGLRYAWFGQPDWAAALGFRPHNLGFFACLEWSPSPALAWLLQADGMTLPYRHPHRWLHGISGSLSFGARLRLSDRLLLQLHASEELFSFAQLDIAAGAALVWTREASPGARRSTAP